jgi:mannose-1-phosphate guanylyltransferase
MAAGEGKRLRSFVHQLRGDTLPKQYVDFTGTGSMLEQTFRRVERLIPSERIFTVVSQDHLAYPEVCEQLSGRPKGVVALQPENKETAPGLLLPLMRLHKRHPESIVMVFPSDHYIREEGLFMDHADLAYRLIEEDPSRLILLGMEPNGPNPEYGYILPGAPIPHLAPLDVRRVLQFVEKPEHHAAQELVRRGGLWNTMVMAFRTDTFLTLAKKIVPELYGAFDRIREEIGGPSEIDAVEETYRDMKPANLSKDFLELLSIQDPSRLALLPVRGVYWNDWGSAQRIINDLRRMERLEGHQSLYGEKYSVGSLQG